MVWAPITIYSEEKPPVRGLRGNGEQKTIYRIAQALLGGGRVDFSREYPCRGELSALREPLLMISRRNYLSWRSCRDACGRSCTRQDSQSRLSPPILTRLGIGKDAKRKGMLFRLALEGICEDLLSPAMPDPPIIHAVQSSSSCKRRVHGTARCKRWT